MQRTPLYSLHLAHNAKMTPFAGYEMPVNYRAGIIQEHLHTRRAAGLFDVSHMGQITIRPHKATDDAQTIATALESLMPSDLINLPAGRQKYGLLTNDAGIRDDLMTQNFGDYFVLVVNAACKQRDFDYIRAKLAGQCAVTLDNNLALLALQGPQAAAVLQTLCDTDLTAMKFMHARELVLAGVACKVSRSGYTGEDGFEISMHAEHAEQLARALIANEQVEFIGLGARDSLRLEAGLCLYGHDITADTTPVEAGLNWAISPARRPGGERAGGFPGDAIILPQLPPESKNITRKRVGLLPQGRAPVREGAKLLDANQEIGVVTSGGFAPSLTAPISIGYVDRAYGEIGRELIAQVRNKELPVTVAKLPFVAPNFYR